MDQVPASTSSASISNQLWNSSWVWTCRALYCPFVQHISRGSLPYDVYQDYKAQDIFFLIHYERAFLAGAELCNGLDQAPSLQSSLKEFFLLNAKQVAEERISVYGPSDVETAHMTRATAAYVKLLQKHSRRSLAELLTCLLPCGRLYAHIGQEIGRAHQVFKPHIPSYLTKWIETYGSTSFEEEVRKSEQLLDLLYHVFPQHSTSSALFPVPLEYDSLEECLARVYRDAVELEFHFFDAFSSDLFMSAPSCVGKFPRLRFLVDFDQTITIKDTVEELPLAAFRARTSNASLIDGSPSAVKWQQAVSTYMTRFGFFLDHELRNEPSFSSFCSSLEAFETEMMVPIIEQRFLAGLSDDVITQVAHSLGDGVRRDFLSFYRLALTRGGHAFSVVSLHWSSKLIEKCLKNVGAPPQKVHSNRLVMGSSPTGEELSTGDIECAVIHGGHKERVVKEYVANAAASGEVVVYVGDSLHDVQAALAADIGILLCRDCVSLSSSVEQVCAKYDVELCPLFAAFPPWLSVGNIGAVANRLFVASSWIEILSWYKHSFLSESSTPIVMSVAGSDSCGGAGIQADIKACEEAGCYCATAITAVTAQSTSGVTTVHNIPPEAVKEQILTSLLDVNERLVIKTGMLPSAECILAVSDAVRQRREGLPGNLLVDVRHCDCMYERTYSRVLPLVVDPVMVTTLGAPLSSNDAVRTLVSELIPLATVLTPNLAEAHLLLGEEFTSSVIAKCVDTSLTKRYMIDICRRLSQLGPCFVLLKGGHLSEQNASIDVLYERETDTAVLVLENERIPGTNTHGTGCTLASSVAAHLAKGYDVEDAVKRACKYVHTCIARSHDLLIGLGTVGSMRHSRRPATLNHAVSIDLKLYAITDSEMIRSNGISLETAVEQAILGGATVVQLREKSGDTRDIIERGRIVQGVCRRYRVPFIVNDRVDVALALDADGLHLGQTDMDITTARSLLGQDVVIGISARSLEEVWAGEQGGADYAGVGAVFDTQTKTDSEAIGIDNLKEICAGSTIPIVAIGGLNLSNVSQVVQAGCKGVAVISALFGGQDIQEQAHLLSHAVSMSRLETVPFDHSLPPRKEASNYDRREIGCCYDPLQYELSNPRAALHRHLWEVVDCVHSHHPLVVCLTNLVSMDIMAVR